MISTAAERFPSHIQSLMAEVESTYNGDQMTINFLMAYSGTQEIAHAAQQAAQHQSHISPETIESHLKIDSPIDYVIRTGDNPTRECLSGFALWQAAYTEYYHLEKNFPAVTLNDINQALNHYDSLRVNEGA